jgi:hypothetical protein
MLGLIGAHFVADVVDGCVAFAVAGVTGITELRADGLAGQQLVPPIRAELARLASVANNSRHWSPSIERAWRPADAVARRLDVEAEPMQAPDEKRPRILFGPQQRVLANTVFRPDGHAFARNGLATLGNAISRAANLLKHRRARRIIAAICALNS